MIRSRVGLLLLCALAGCVGGGFKPAPIEAGALSTEESERAVSLISDRVALSGRLRNIEYNIVTGAAVFCGQVVRPDLGVVLASEKTFTGRIARTAAREKIGLGAGVTIMHVVPGSPIAQAGIQAGDIVLTAEGKTVASQQDLFQAVYQNVGDSVKLEVQRAEERLERVVSPEKACPVSLEYVQSAQLLPDALSRKTAGVPRGLVRLFPKDDELAIVIGHQLAHLIFDRPGDSELAKEQRADSIGLYLTARAGYDIDSAVAVWETLVGEYPWLAVPRPPPQYSGYPHRSVALRTEGIRKTVADIQALKARGADLIPPS